MSRGEPCGFVAEIASVIVHYAVEVSPDLLSWMDDSTTERARAIFQELTSIDGIEEGSVEYNGHFGPFVFFACEQDKAPAATAAVVAIIAKCDRSMRRSVTRKVGAS